MIVQSIVSLTGFYTDTDDTPPKFVLLLAPPVLFIGFLFASRQGRKYIDGLSSRFLVLLHVIRFPVEVILFFLFIHHGIPKLMTFEGVNFDILSGLTAPVIYYFGFVKKKLPATVILLWNIGCLGLLVNIVVHAIFAAPFPFQKIAFDQPNIAVLYFPFTILPSVIVPIVLFCHLASIRQVINQKLTTRGGSLERKQVASL